MDDHTGLIDLQLLITKTLIPGIKEARRLRSLEDDEAEPYKSKYASADLLQSLEQQATRYLDTGSAHEAFVSQCIAQCQLERGMVLLETDLTADGQKALEQGLAYGWPTTKSSHAILQQGYNALGGLWCSREDFETSLKYLQTAAEVYDKIKAMHHSASAADDSNLSATVEPAADACHASANADECSVLAQHSWEEAFASDADHVEQHYTTTLYYLAQVYSYAGDRVRSASYCAATLNRQLREGETAQPAN